jgi:hypothetical protein
MRSSSIQPTELRCSHSWQTRKYRTSSRTFADAALTSASVAVAESSSPVTPGGDRSVRAVPVNFTDHDSGLVRIALHANIFFEKFSITHAKAPLRVASARKSSWRLTPRSFASYHRVVTSANKLLLSRSNQHLAGRAARNTVWMSDIFR